MTNQHNDEPKKVGRPTRLNSVEGVSRKIEEYFDRQDKLEKPYSILGLSQWLGICQDTFYEIGKREEFTDLIKMARERIESSYVEKLVTPGTNTTGLIFVLKNNYKWVDKQEVKQEVKAEVNAKIEDFFKDNDQEA